MMKKSPYYVSFALYGSEKKVFKIMLGLCICVVYVVYVVNYTILPGTLTTLPLISLFSLPLKENLIK